ncbi:MAG: ABC transporter permease [Bacteroidota bacterium]
MKSSNGFLHDFLKNKTLLVMLIPALVYIIIFSYVPLAGLVVAFKDYNYIDGLFKSPWNGIENFRFFFVSGKALLITKNTILYNISFLLTNTILNIGIAIMVAEMGGKFLKKIFQSMLFLPFFVSWVVVASFTYNIFNYEFGVINTLFRSLHIAPVDFYGTKWLWPILLPIFNAWKYVGYESIIYLAAIMGFDAEIYESAEIDGASVFQRIRHITLPLLTPTMILLILMALGRILRGNFEMFYQLVGTIPVLQDSTDIIDTFVFRALVNGSDFGMASAIAFYQSVLCFVTIIVANKLVKMVRKDYALF